VQLRPALLDLEQHSRGGETQVFIETPYRNLRLFDALLRHCAPTTRLALATDLTLANESIGMRSIGEWRARSPAQRPQLERRPTVFGLLAASVSVRRAAR
jgi:16S rRNA (cytidine1402-2'-O)-methyltransferase